MTLDELRQDLIEGLIRNAERHPDFMGDSGGYEMELRSFEEVVWEIACKAQRFACLKAVREHWAADEIRDDVLDAILSTESPEHITKRFDYLKQKLE